MEILLLAGLARAFPPITQPKLVSCPTGSVGAPRFCFPLRARRVTSAPSSKSIAPGWWYWGSASRRFWNLLNFFGLIAAAGVIPVTVGNIKAGTLILKLESMGEVTVMLTYPLVVPACLPPIPTSCTVENFLFRPRQFAAFSLMKVDWEPLSRRARYGWTSPVLSSTRTLAVGRITVLTPLLA